MLLNLSRLTDDFRAASIEFFDIASNTHRLLMDGRSIDPSGNPEQDHQAWNCSLNEFCPEKAIRGTLHQKLHEYSVSLIDYVLEETGDFSRVGAGWIYSNPQALPVLIAALGPYSKRGFNGKHALSNPSDRSISMKDAEKIARLFMHNDVESRSKIESNIRTTSEGIIRDLIGKILYEDIVERALTEFSLPFVREAENRVLEGSYMSARPDFSLPDPVVPKAFIEVRKSSAAHSSLYANDKCWSAINWKSRHPELLAVILYAGAWSRPSIETLKSVYDYVLPISESRKAAQLILAHLNGDPTVLKRQVRLQIDQL